MNVIQHNMNAMFSERQLSITTGIQAKSSEKLSSGYRINRAADDAAGLSMSEKMRRQIRGLTQASKNAQDGVSLLQIADGAMNEDHEMLQRMNELAVKAANGTLQSMDRAYIDYEIQKLKEEITAISGKTTFNELNLFPEDGYSPKDDSDDENVIATQDFQISIGRDGTFTVSASDPMIADNNIVNKVAAADGWQKLATHIADELIPNAVNQILNTFPAFQGDGIGDNINVALRVEYIDGPSNTLAYAQFGYSGNGTTATADKNSFQVKVDSKDFSDKSLTDNKKITELESTLAHELMHTVMQNTLTSGMAYSYPKWFKEGTAQVAGGGFTTGWNDYLVNAIEGKDESAAKATLQNELKKYTVEDRVYGHGYLAAAYIGMKASGQTEVNAANIADGLNKVFTRLLAGDPLDTAINTATGGALTSAQDAAGKINQANADAVDFVYQLINKTAGGAGSVIGGDLSKTGADIIDAIDSMKGEEGRYTIDPNVNAGGKKLILQVGSENSENDRLSIKLFKMNAKELGLEDTNVLTQTNAQNAISEIKEALQLVSKVRSYYGATQNRLEHTIRNLNNIVENTTASESLIRDTDMSEEMVRFSNNNILAQAGQSMLAQANQSNQGTLTLLGR